MNCVFGFMLAQNQLNEFRCDANYEEELLLTERRLIEVLTEVCEEAKNDNVGFIWLTHFGHWRSPEVIAVFSRESDKLNASTNKWNIDFINKVNIAVESIKAIPQSVSFTSEEACKKQSKGDWERHFDSVRVVRH